ncbi:hypothetical protein ACFWGM_17515 [Streptomyces roseolus]|uniref:hypothetical protein n=1 Tax=Streptomyces roseolus TaxID=67358 RepID=UPI0036362038
MSNYDDTAVWAPSNTGTKVHAFIGLTVDGTRFRAACRANITREKSAILKDRSAFTLVCETCEAKWDAHRARVERSLEPLQPCESFEVYGAAPVAEGPCCEHASIYHGARGCGECACTAPRAGMAAHGGIVPAPAAEPVPAAPRARRDRHTARRVLADRRRTNRAAARLRRRGVATMASHCITQGLRPSDARSMASSLRRNAAKAGCEGRAGTSHAGRRPARACTRYTPSEVAVAASAYRPRRDDFRAVRAALMAVSS